MNTIFPHQYELLQLTEGPGRESLPHFYYPNASRIGGRDGIIIEVHPENSEPWLGTFAFGQLGPRGVSGIFTTPNPKQFCAVAKGQGYFVNAISPTSWERVQIVPVIDVRPILSQKLIVFASYTRMIGYGPLGKMWQTGELSWSDLTITEVTDKTIRGEFCDPLNGNSTAGFVVDLATGVHQGGKRLK